MGDTDRRSLAAVLIAGLAACADPQAARDAPAPAEDSDLVTADPHAPAAAPGVPEALLQTLREDAAARGGVAPAAVRVVSARPMRWNDGSMGCPRPGESYIQVIVDGYWVVLEAQGREYDYRANQAGGFALCADPPPNPGGRPRDVS